MHWTHFNSRLQSEFIVRLKPKELVNGLQEPMEERERGVSYTQPPHVMQVTVAIDGQPTSKVHHYLLSLLFTLI